MNKRFIWTVLFLIVIGGTVFFLTRKPKEEVVEEDQVIEETDEEEVVEEETEEEETTEESNTDFSSFSTESQVLGEESDVEFSIESVENEAMDGYHKFTFLLKSEEEGEPFVTASYMSNIGVIRMDFQSISKDSTGIGYQEEESIDTEGISKIYHNVSAQSDQELYDIGVTESTPFKLTSEELENGEWNVILEVKYPGTREVSIDLGSEEYSTDTQSIEGITSTENASITSYTYGRPEGLLKFVWSVGGDGDNPIPGVEASYNADNELVVVFNSLVMDRIANFSESLTLSSSIIATVERTGEKSVYTFTGMGSQREYRLSASLSPNQVVLEIK